MKSSVRPTISVCLIVKNEAKLIGRCLRSVAPIADEVVVIDTGSTDGTARIARSFGARVIPHRWTTFARARNAYLRAARSRWILVIDGDESIARRDLPRIRALVARPGAIGYRLTVRNYSDEFDLLWRWSPNDGRYPREEKASRCAGWMKTVALRLFRNFDDLSYDAGSPSAHPTPLESLRRHRGRVEIRDDVVIHHFQFLKGVRFVATKQRARLRGEFAEIRRRPEQPYSYLNAARSLFALGRDREAAALLKRVLKRAPSFQDAYQLLGMIALASGDLSRAETYAGRSVRIDPTNADAWTLAGIVRIEAGHLAAGRRALARALALHPGHLMAHNSLGVLYEDLGRYREAIAQYRTARRLHPRFLPAARNLARVTRLMRRAR